MSSSKILFEYDCTRKCKIHGNTINEALTKRAVSDAALASFMKTKCMNYIQSIDGQGRSSLHLSAARGRCSLLEWLAKQCSKGHLNLRDLESGYTALHCSIFYGQIHAAVKLYSLGIDTEILDNQDLRAIDHVLYDRIPRTFRASMSPAEVYVWGSNTNYTLGTVSQQQRKVPELVSSLLTSKGAPEKIIQVCLGKFHSIWVTANGGVWACGQAARCTGALLSATSASTATAGEMLVKPRPLKLPEPCAQAAVTLYGTVLLFNSGTVMQYGEDSNSPKALLRLSDSGWAPGCTGGIRTCRTGCIAWGPLRLYSWGSNKGNLGHDTNYMHISTPKMVTCITSGRMDDETMLVCADICDVASVVANSRGDVYLLHGYHAKKILTKQLNAVDLKIDAPENGPITVLLLTNVGNVYHWQDTTSTLSRCIYSLKRPIFVTDMTLNKDRLLITTRNGEAFFGNMNPPPRAQPNAHKKNQDPRSKISEFHRFLSRRDCCIVQLERIANIHRAICIAKDFEGSNFAILQASGDPSVNKESKGPPTVSPSSMSEDLLKLKEDTHLADIIFTVGKRQYPAHIFIIAHHSVKLYSQYKELSMTNAGQTPTIPIDDIHPDIFENLLTYFYSGTCELLQVGKCNVVIKPIVKDADISADNILCDSNMSAFEVHQKQKNTPKFTEKRTKKSGLLNPLKLLQDAAKKLQVNFLGKILDKFIYKDGYIHSKDINTSSSADKSNLKLDRSKFMELCDTFIKCDGGSVIKAHRCMLSARLEYFNAMFSHSWAESKAKSEVVLPISSAFLESIVMFVYTDECPDINQSQSLEQVCSFLVIADQLFIGRLRQLCEVRLSQMINLKNCTEMCQFASTYNATQLKRYCMEYVIINLYWYLENRALDILNDSLLAELTEFYISSNPVMQNRIITPAPTAPSDEIVVSCIDIAPVNLDTDYESDLYNEENLKKNKTKNKRLSMGNYERSRVKHESISSVDSLDMSNCNIEDSLSSLSTSPKAPNPAEKDSKTWVKIVSPQQKAVLARLKAVTTAKEDKSVLDMPNNSFTNLTNKLHPQTSFVDPNAGKFMPATFISLRDLVESPGSGSLPFNIGKLSQKQRKKLEAEQKLKTITSKDPTEKEVSPPPIVSPWKIICDQPKHEPKVAVMEYFDDIMNDEVKQRENLMKMKTKPLNLTQLEDRAIDDLKRFYNVFMSDEELITIKRNDSAKIATPQWIHHKH